jgi:hypothetical protein
MVMFAVYVPAANCVRRVAFTLTWIIPGVTVLVVPTVSQSPPLTSSSATLNPRSEVPLSANAWLAGGRVPSV